ncbi:hypothetical protein FEM48_Zijuj01G0105500 [Ziziphus jujuba var. spinosa]|uniref:non-specific serine/threonine protein kinase n=1 Tax=Ziziphus jujuba var. spinosa TaxID=714518 RepID=A0A978W0R6_ZIZJJ|nr:hypothetical protein FEM48_Zijuj01G0105500 [Ziziphus jujuba var. spinosa]
MRYKSIEDIVQGLFYLREDSLLKTIHRDLQDSNILLDVEMNPTILDFVMAKLFKVDETQANTSRILGTYRYMAPKYAGHFSAKSDVCSYGVSFFEIVSGQKINSFCYGENAEDL